MATQNFEDFDDFVVDDLLSKKRKPKINGGRKGKRAERELCQLLFGRFGKEFSRSVGSGNRWSQANIPVHCRNAFSGDIVCPEHFKWVLESKGGYDGIDLNTVFVRGNSELDNFLEQVTKDSNRCGRKPMLCWKRDRKPWLAFVHTRELRGFPFKYRMLYKQWSAVDLKTLLKIDNSFFFENQVGVTV